MTCVPAGNTSTTRRPTFHSARKMAGSSELNEKEAFLFLKDVLGMASPEGQLATSRVNFLDDLLRVLQHNLPFQTVEMIAQPPNSRRLPTIRDIKAGMQARLGGLCYQLNTFLWMLLRAISFDASLVASDVLSRKNDHIAVVVRGLTHPHSSHLVDIGNGCPSYRAISLDFDQVSPEYRDSFLRYRFVRQEGGIVVRQHSVDSDPSKARAFSNHTEDGWFSFFFFHVDQVVSLSHFDQAMTKTYTTVVDAPPYFLTCIRCVAYPNGRLVSIVGATLMIENEQGEVCKTYLKSRDEIVQAYGRHFPQIPKSMVEAAMDDDLVTLDFTREL